MENWQRIIVVTVASGLIGYATVSYLERKKIERVIKTGELDRSDDYSYFERLRLRLRSLPPSPVEQRALAVIRSALRQAEGKEGESAAISLALIAGTASLTIGESGVVRLDDVL